MLVDEVEDLLLESATINAIILQSQCDHSFVVHYSMEKSLQAKIQIVQRQVNINDWAWLTNDLC